MPNRKQISKMLAELKHASGNNLPTVRHRCMYPIRKLIFDLFLNIKARSTSYSLYNPIKAKWTNKWRVYLNLQLQSFLVSRLIPYVIRTYFLSENLIFEGSDLLENEKNRINWP